jgi:hypothetical protein
MRITARGEQYEGKRSHAASLAHVLACMLVTTACDKGKSAPVQREKQVEVPVSPPAGDAGVPASIAVDLFRAVPSTVRLSSQVRNKDILPEHIVDQNRETAWNSATGKLVGTWIEVSVVGAQIHDVMLTVGHTGHGAKGDDYFLMNPRIRQVSLSDDGKPLGVFDLDIDTRGLQTIHVSPHGTLRITVTQIEPGTKKNWREVAISELEVWGTPDAGWTTPKKPLVPTVIVDGATYHGDDPCAGIDEERAEGEANHRYDDSPGPGGDDHNYPPRCDELALPDIASLPAPWSSANARCRVNDSIYGPKDCMVNFRAGTATASIAYSSDAQSADVSVVEMAERDVIPGGRPELVVRFRFNDLEEYFGICRAEPLGCTATVEATGLDDAAAVSKAPLVFDH